MRFIIAYAGIPQVVFNRVQQKQAQIIRTDADWIAKPLPASGRYDSNYCSAFAEAFADRIRKDHHNSLDETGFAVICVASQSLDPRPLFETFFPSVMVRSIDWRLASGSNMQLAMATNELVDQLSAVTAKVKSSLAALRKELQERAQRTPLLLPLRNFRSPDLVEKIKELQEGLPVAQDPNEEIRRIVGDIEAKHSRVRDERKLWFFVNDRNVLFRPPGNDRHAFARPQTGHPASCLLSGRRRLGAPYDKAFHYDCTRKNDAQLRGPFFGCHEDEEEKVGNPHLNISPNDFVRPHK